MANMDHEIPDFDFDRVKKDAQKTWEKRLAQIEVSGGTEAHKRTFYTALYRCSERMVDINEYGRFFSAWDRKVHESEEPFFVDNWIWDTHIALEPLQTILTLSGDTMALALLIPLAAAAMVSFSHWPSHFFFRSCTLICRSSASSSSLSV